MHCGPHIFHAYFLRQNCAGHPQFAEADGFYGFAYIRLA